MSVAGIWETWRPGTRQERRSFTVLTTAANRFMREIHDRMPVILDRSLVSDWLNPEIHDRNDLEQILQRLTAAEVSQLVNSPRNNGPELLEPVTFAIADAQQRQ